MQTSIVDQETSMSVVDGYVATWVVIDGGSVAHRLYDNQYIYEVVIHPTNSSRSMSQGIREVESRTVPEASFKKEMQRLWSMRANYPKGVINEIMGKLEAQRRRFDD